MSAQELCHVRGNSEKKLVTVMESRQWVVGWLIPCDRPVELERGREEGESVRGVRCAGLLTRSPDTLVPAWELPRIMSCFIPIL